MDFILNVSSKLLSYFLLIVIVRFIIKKASSEDKIVTDANGDVAYIRKTTYSKIYFWIAVTFGLLCIIINSFPSSGNEKNLVSSIFITLSVLCFIISFMYKRWYIRLEQDKIVYHNMLGKYLTIDLNSVTHYKFSEHGEICLCQNETTLFTIFSVENRKFLIDILKKNQIREKRDKQSKEFTIKADPVQKWVIAFLTVFLLAFGSICVKAKFLIGIVFFVVMFSLSVGCCLHMFLDKIVFGTKEIVQYRFMRKPRRIPFSDIERVEVREVDNAECYDFILKNKKKLRINMAYTNTYLLEKLVEKRKWIK